MPAERKAPEPPEEPAADEEEEQTPASGAATPRQFGGTRVDETGRVTYTEEGAVSATPGGPLDPTIDPDYRQPGVPPGGATTDVVDREDVEGLTGDKAKQP